METVPSNLSDLARLFLRLGFTAFGGPAAHIAIMRQEVVERLGWMDEEEFFRLLGIAQFLPGPSSSQLAILIGYRRSGWRGLVLAGLCFISPAVALVLALSWCYRHWGGLPQVAAVLAGVKPVILAIMLEVAWSLRKPVFKRAFYLPLGLMIGVGGAQGLSLFSLLYGAGVVGAAVQWCRGSSKSVRSALILLGLALVTLAGPRLLAFLTGAPGGHVPETFSNVGLFWFFLKLGALFYGSGYLLVAFLDDGLVTARGWLTSSQVFDAIAMGQITPGPVFSTATFVGYLMGDLSGALIATAAIFLPSFFLAWAGQAILTRVGASPLFQTFLEGVNVAALALLLQVCWPLGREAIRGPVDAILALGCLVVLLRGKQNATRLWLLLSGALVGLVGASIRV